MSLLLSLLFSPSGVVVSMVVAALWLWRRPSSVAARRFLFIAALCFTCASIYVVPFGVSRLLTLGYHQFSAADLGQGGHGTTAVVVLGGADEFVEGWTDHITVTTVGEASRVLEASRVFRLTSPVWLISSGGSSNSPERTDASSVTMRDELVRLGVPPERILLESTSRNTYDEAVLIAPMLRSHAVQQLVLVTSDTHMRRALGAFRAAGWNAVPAIAPHPKAPLGWVWWMLPTVFGLELSSEVTHELLGIPYYWVRGRWRS